MNRLNDSQAQVNTLSPVANAVLVLHEIRYALTRLLESGQETTIDLRNLPLGPVGINHLLDVLGNGEVEANLNALGTSRIRETRFPGVWLVEHFNTDEQPVGRFIEVTYVPSLLPSQPEDVRSGWQVLAEELGKT
jgi:hydrogenase-1 operon protein HyaF